MSHDPTDTNVDREAFWAAYRSLEADGVSLAQVRGDVAKRLVDAVIEERDILGPYRMHELADNLAERQVLADELAAANPEEFTSVTRSALYTAVAAAARTLAGA